MTSTGDVVFVGKQLFVGNPPREVTGGNFGDQGLDSVLAIGNSSALGCTVGPITCNTLATDTATVDQLAKNADITCTSLEAIAVGATEVIASSSMVMPTLRANTIQSRTPETDLNITANNITSTGTIQYAAFDPPLSSVGTPSLAATMTVDNSVGLLDLNLNERNIINVNSITTAYFDATGTTAVPIPLVRMFGNDAEIIFDPFDTGTKTGTKITGAATTLTKCTNLDLSTGNTFPAAINGDLAATLALGNSAGTNNINMNSQSITAANTLEGKTITASGTTLNEGQIAAARQVSAPIINVLTPYAGQPQNSGITFAGITTTTEIAGPSVSNPTVCTNLDLRSGTNLFTASENEQYEWGGYWRDPRTLRSDSQEQQQVFMASYEDDVPGWRYFRPMSDGNDQIKPTTEAKNEYIAYTSTANPPIGFFVKTAPTLIAAHNSQIITLTFPITRYGYGRIYLGLYYVPDATPSATPVFIDDSFRLFTENIAQPGFADVRKSGYTTMTWNLKDIPNYPVDGTQWRVYPVMRTDDEEENGALEIRIGDTYPVDADFGAGQAGSAQNGQLSMYGRPWPDTFEDFSLVYTTDVNLAAKK